MALITTYPDAASPNVHTGLNVRWPLLAITAAIVAVDRLTKLAVEQHLLLGGRHIVIPGVFAITHVLNTGAAFSAFAESTSPTTVRYTLIAFSALAILIVGTMLWRSGRAFTLSGLALALILGGAIGNLYDRIWLHYVVDFLEVRIIHYHWPDFNVADSAIVVGACLLILEIFRPQPKEVQSSQNQTTGATRA